MLRTSLAEMPGVQSEVMTFLGDRIGESISGETAAVVLNFFGEDFTAIDSTAQVAATKLNGITGARDVQVKAPPGAPRVAIDLDLARLTERGFQPVEVLEAIQTMVQGAVIGQVYDHERTTDIAVTLPVEGGLQPEALGARLLRNPIGQLVRLDAIADVHLTTGRFSILHDGGWRRQTVTCNVAGRDVASFSAEARRILLGLPWPPGVYWDLGGTAEAQATATHELWWHAAIAGVGIVLLLSIVLGSCPNVILVLGNLPFALVGGVFALWLAGVLGGAAAGSLNMGSMVGFVTLFGITTRNAIMLISRYEHLVSAEAATWNISTAVRGASERLIPILMTALVTGLALLPLALVSGSAGREIEGPMAVVILGGLFTSTGLNLLLLPALAVIALPSIYAKEHEAKNDDKESEEKIAWADMPAVVQTTISLQIGEGKIIEVERETEPGRVNYEAKVRQLDGSYWEVTVDAQGALQKVERKNDDDEKEDAKSAKSQKTKSAKEKSKKAETS